MMILIVMIMMAMVMMVIVMMVMTRMMMQLMIMMVMWHAILISCPICGINHHPRKLNTGLSGAMVGVFSLTPNVAIFM